MPNPEAFRLRLPWDSPANEQQHADNWRTVKDWDVRLAATGRTLINQISLPAGTTLASVNWPNIPQTYNNLHIMYDAQNGGLNTGGPNALLIFFNGDHTANYWWEETGTVSGGAPVSASGVGTVGSRCGATAASFAARSGVGTITIPNYAEPGHHFIQGVYQRSAFDGSASQSFQGGFWYAGGGPVHRIELISDTSIFQPFSYFSLYGEA
jgi:hypothetical protein